MFELAWIKRLKNLWGRILMNNSVIISGGDGFIGSHMAKYLANAGYDVFALVVPNNPNTKNIQSIQGVTIVEGDLFDINSFKNKLPSNPVAFFHFAWIGVAPEQRKITDVQKNNIELTINAVMLANSIHAQKFIFPGSTFEYSFSGTVINRYTNPSPQDAYGAAKISAKYFSQILCNEYGIDYMYCVISGIYSEDRLDNNVITYTINSLLQGKKPSLTKLEQKWDYVYIDDVVEAFEYIIRKGKNNAFYVIGHGDNCPLSEYIYTIRDLIDKKLPLGIGEIPYPNNSIPMSCVDLTELKEDTGFEPRVPFRIGIVKVIENIKKRGCY